MRILYVIVFFVSFIAEGQKGKRSPVPTPVPTYSPSYELQNQSTLDEDTQKLPETSSNSLFPKMKRFSVMLPNGGSPAGSSSVGLGYMWEANMAVSLYAQASYDKEKKKSALGVTTRLQRYFLESEKVVSFVYVQGSVGQNLGDGNKGNDLMQMGTSAGGGVEVFLLRQLSLALEGGVSYVFLPADKQTLATGTNGISLNVYF